MNKKYLMILAYKLKAELVFHKFFLVFLSLLGLKNGEFKYKSLNKQKRTL